MPLTSSLVYNGRQINERGELLSLTDMWRAAEGTPSQGPSEWARKEGSSFIEFMETTTPYGRSELIQALNEAGTWNTWAHWQIGMAYAKYLSPEFHAWCNQVVRDHMEGRGAPVSAMQELVAVVRDLGVFVRQGMGKQETRTTAIESDVRDLRGDVCRIERKVDEIAFRGRRRISQKTRAQLTRETNELGGRCPCCGLAVVVEDGKKVQGAEFDHFYVNSAPNADYVWLICSDCHSELTRNISKRDERNAEFQAFQRKRRRLPGVQLKLVI